MLPGAWLAGSSAAVTAFNGPVNLDWMMTGPQADFWPSRVYTGQFYSENTPMRILAWRGQVVEGLTTAPVLRDLSRREAVPPPGAAACVARQIKYRFHRPGRHTPASSYSSSSESRL